MNTRSEKFNTFAITGEKSTREEPFKIYLKIPKKDRWYIYKNIHMKKKNLKTTSTKTSPPDCIFCFTVSVPLFCEEETNGEVREAQITPSSDSLVQWGTRGELNKSGVIHLLSESLIQALFGLMWIWFPIMYSSAETSLGRFRLFLSSFSFTDVLRFPPPEKGHSVTEGKGSAAVRGSGDGRQQREGTSLTTVGSKARATLSSSKTVHNSHIQPFKVIHSQKNKTADNLRLQ